MVRSGPEDRLPPCDTRAPAARPRELDDAIRAMAQTDETDRGAVFTRPEVASAILDLAGYTEDRPLHLRHLLEPSCGGGDFLLPALDRLLAAYEAHGGTPQTAAQDLAPALCAVEVHPQTLAGTAARIAERLRTFGASDSLCRTLLAAWLRCDDFLLAPLSGPFDFVVGNPPYVRIERVPAPLLSEYRRRYRTLYDRADLYIGFYERSLDLLAPEGRLGFLCANRWLKNRYGGPLRERISRDFHLEHVIDLAGADAFRSEVDAYPAITVIRRVSGRAPERQTERQTERHTRLARRPELDAPSLARLVRALQRGGPADDPRIEEVVTSHLSGAPWLLESAPRLALLRRLEQSLPDLAGAGCRVGIGVATGCDAVFIADRAALPVEEARKLPLAMAQDLRGGVLAWGGRGVVNPFEPSGALADLDRYPRFGDYIRKHEASLSARHCARNRTTGWYRTIDRIWPELVKTPKLLIPDIQGEATVAFDEGRFYPHHNVYFVTAKGWDLRALQAVLRSSVALWFVASYCVRMAGGFLRFQAQYLRRIRIPRWDDVPESLRTQLSGLAECGDTAALDAAVSSLYGLTRDESVLVREAAEAARVRPRRPPRPRVPEGSAREECTRGVHERSAREE
jgi:hypothetical protein